MKVSCIIVCFHPDETRVASLCSTLRASDAEVIVVDNTPGNEGIKDGHLPGCHLHRAYENLGIAAAQNIGIEIAHKLESEVVVFLDQDSRVEAPFLAALLAPLESAQELTVLAPVCRDERKGYEYPSVRLARWGLPQKVYSGKNSAPYPVDIIISSGSAVTTAALRRAGPMDEDFFIDGVDTEWCIRARRKGVSIRVVPTVTIDHSIGDATVDARVLRAHIHSPVRTYFKTRNSLLMFRFVHVPFLFALREVSVLFLHHAVTLAVSPQRFAHLRQIALGVLDAIRGRLGPQRS
jgi:rhamnosyltransferase